MDPQESLKQLYKQYVGSEPTEIKLMDKAGSNRRYYRLSGDKSIVGVIGESREENEAFIYIATHFKEQGLSVPTSSPCLFHAYPLKAVSPLNRQI